MAGPHAVYVQVSIRRVGLMFQTWICLVLIWAPTLRLKRKHTYVDTMALVWTLSNVRTCNQCISGTLAGAAHCGGPRICQLSPTLDNHCVGPRNILLCGTKIIALSLTVPHPKTRLGTLYKWPSCPPCALYGICPPIFTLFGQYFLLSFSFYFYFYFLILIFLQKGFYN